VHRGDGGAGSTSNGGGSRRRLGERRRELGRWTRGGEASAVVVAVWLGEGRRRRRELELELAANGGVGAAGARRRRGEAGERPRVGGVKRGGSRTLPFEAKRAEEGRGRARRPRGRASYRGGRRARGVDLVRGPAAADRWGRVGEKEKAVHGPGARGRGARGGRGARRPGFWIPRAGTRQVGPAGHRDKEKETRN
jgi:hypothetical protein